MTVIDFTEAIARLAPGVTVAQAEAEGTALARGADRPLADLVFGKGASGRSARAAARRTDDDEGEAGVDGAGGRCHAGAADCVRQPRQSVPLARQRAQPRAGGTRRARRGTPPPDASALHRKPCHRAARRRARHRSSARRSPPPCRCSRPRIFRASTRSASTRASSSSPCSPRSSPASCRAPCRRSEARASISPRRCNPAARAASARPARACAACSSPSKPRSRSCLLIGAALLARSFAALVAVDAGYDADRVLTANVRLPADPADKDMRATRSAPSRSSNGCGRFPACARRAPATWRRSAACFPVSDSRFPA